MNNKIKVMGIILLMIMTVFITGCDTTSLSADQMNQQKVKEVSKSLTELYPVPTLTKSLERKNLADRALVLNDDNKVFYVYLMSHGKVVAFFTARSKVSSLNSYLNGQEKVTYIGNGEYGTIDSADVDGSYGKNADGVFFFTTEGSYVEWSGEYLASDFPLSISTPVELTREVK